VAHGDRGNPESTSDLGLGEAGAEELEAGQATFFESGGVTMALSPSSHAKGQSTSRIIT
jgi:hypothetical protein